MADNELLIRINGDAKNAKKAFDDVKAQTEDLQKTLNTAGVIGAAAFAGVTAAAVFSVMEFEKAETALRGVSNALQNQGIYTDELRNKYKGYADEVERIAGIEAEAVLSAQATAQGYLGQIEVTQELTTAIANLATSKKIDLNSAATIVAKSIGTETNALKREGLELDATATKAEKYAKVLEFLDSKYKDSAATANQGFGAALKALDKSFGDVAENLGKRLQPVLEGATRLLASFFDVIAGSDAMSDLIVAVMAGVAVFGAIVAAAPAVLVAFTTIKAAAVAAGVAINGTLLLIPALIAAAVAGLVLLALNWDQTMNFLKASLSAAWTVIKELGGSIAKVLEGIFTLDGDKITEGLNQAKGAFAKGVEEYKAIRAQYVDVDAQAQTEQDAQKKAAADREAAKEREHQARLLQIRREGDELILLQMQGASKAQQDLQKEEIDILKALNEEKTAIERQALQSRLEIVRALQEEQRAQDLQRSIEFEQEKQALELELAQQGFDLQANLSAAQQAQLEASLMTEKEIEQKFLADKLKARIDANNQQLLEQKKFGATFAAINRVIQSEEVQGAKDAAGELVQLTQSKNSTLKAIGKAAALVQIAIATSESAMNIYRGFSTIPIIGPALGVAGAAAAVAFGAERAGEVIGAAEGGLLTGGIPGVDSIPVLAQQGELVAPAKNFEEVVGGVQMYRNGFDLSPLVERLDVLAERILAIRTTTIIGDVLADEAYIDSLIRKIVEGVETRNARLVATEVL